MVLHLAMDKGTEDLRCLFPQRRNFLKMLRPKSKAWMSLEDRTLLLAQIARASIEKKESALGLGTRLARFVEPLSSELSCWSTVVGDGRLLCEDQGSQLGFLSHP